MCYLRFAILDEPQASPVLAEESQSGYLRFTLSGPPNPPRLESLIGDRPQLDSLIINIELTLTSIIQGVALSFLCENAISALNHGRIQDLPYIANGLLLILLFWSRSIGHTLTLIRWPLDFTHNFFYFGAAFLGGRRIWPARQFCCLVRNTHLLFNRRMASVHPGSEIDFQAHKGRSRSRAGTIDGSGAQRPKSQHFLPRTRTDRVSRRRRLVLL